MMTVYFFHSTCDGLPTMSALKKAKEASSAGQDELENLKPMLRVVERKGQLLDYLMEAFQGQEDFVG